MRKKNKYIALFMFIPVMIMLLHSIIPHHHHFETIEGHGCAVENHNIKSCDTIHKHSDENTETCDACHFNTKTLSKSTLSNLFIHSFLIVLWKRNSTQNRKIFLTELPIPKSKKYQRYYSLRAPPHSLQQNI